MAGNISTCLMFEGTAEEAMNLYVLLFRGSKITRIERYGPGERGEEGSVKKATFLLGSHRMNCIDSPKKHAFTFTPSMSLFIDCEDEYEMDHAFSELSEGGNVLMAPGNYGCSRKFAWVQDRFGVSWQINLP